MDTPSPLLVSFARGVIARLSTWSILSIAVSSSWGGPSSSSKRTWLASELVDAFENSATEGGEDAEWVEEMLLQVMEDEFNTAIEDGSAIEVARDIVLLWKNLNADLAAAQTTIQDWETRADKMKGKKIDVHVEEAAEEQGEEDWTDDDEDEDHDAEMDTDKDPVPELVPRKVEPVIDEDGFTLVQGKGKKR